MEKISFENWKKMDLRVGEIKGVKDHPNADKLYLLLVDLGKGEHDIQLVAGLKENYSKKDLIGKKVAVFANLKSVKIRGEESAGMILAATFKDKVVLLSPEKDIETGAKIE